MPFKHTLTESKSFAKVQKAKLVVQRVPAWLYHNKHDAKIVTTQEEYNEAIAAGWMNSPAEVGTAKTNS